MKLNLSQEQEMNPEADTGFLQREASFSFCLFCLLLHPRKHTPPGDAPYLAPLRLKLDQDYN